MLIAGGTGGGESYFILTLLIKLIQIQQKLLHKSHMLHHENNNHNVPHRITQDFMLLGAEKDHLIRIEKYKDAIDSLKNVKSLTYRMFTEKENAASHCNTGNPKLVLNTIISWIKTIKNRDE